MGVIETILQPRARDLGGFSVRRILPATERQMVGPFIFLDHMGPATLPAGQGVDVRPHPHIGLATVTWLFAGELLHRDSLGCVQVIRPGEVNWMTAGRGIVHSERTPPEARQSPAVLHGMQSWIALPEGAAETDPAFHHYPAEALPGAAVGGVRYRVIAGSLFGLTSPVPTFSAMGYAAVELRAGSGLDIPPAHPELAIYLVDGAVTIGDEALLEGCLAVLTPGVTATVRAGIDSRCMVLGGEPADGPRHIWWNFVASSTARIEQAKSEWKAGRFATVPGETEFIPLPPA